MESSPKRLKTILQKWFINIEDSQEGISLLEGLAVSAGGTLLAKLLYKLSEDDLSEVCKASDLISRVCRKFHLMKRFSTNALYTFGNGYMGSLGDGKADYTHYVSFPQRIKKLPPIATVSCGDTYTAIITQNGELYVFGHGFQGRLGTGDENNVSIPQKLTEIPKVSQVSCGQSHTAFVTQDGDLYTFGSANSGKLGHGRGVNVSYTPKKVVGIPKVLQVSCGHDHTAFITLDGDLYTFGNGIWWHFPIDDPFDASYTPRKVPNIPKVSQVSCGTDKTIILTYNRHELYVYDNRRHVLKIISMVPKISQISCGWTVRAFVTDDGDLYTFGTGYLGNGRRGDDDGETTEPQKIENLPPISMISCGGEHVAFVARNGDLYTFGNGYFGRLGDKDTSIHTVLTPYKVEGIPPVSTVSCGDNHTAFVTRSEVEMGFEEIRLPCSFCIGNEANYFAVEDGKAYCGDC